MEKSRVRRSAFVTLGFFLLFLFVVTSFPSSSAEIVNICGIWCCDTPGEVGGSCVKANTGGVCTLGDPMIPRGGNGPCPPLATCDPINLICVRDDSFVATSFGTCTQSPDPFPASCFVDITSWEDVRCGAPWITTDCGGFDVIDSGECLLTQMTQKTSTVISCPGPDVSTFEYQCVEDVSCEVVPEPGLWCCDDDDDDLWTGTDPVSSFLGTCTNLFTSGREKVCSDFAFAGSEGDACDDDVDRNPGVPEVCGNDIDENCDGVIEECDDNCGDTWKMGGEECDDGNTANGDGCSSTCELEPGYWCDHGWPSFNLWHCFTTRCGDGVQNPEEECDDGNRNSGDGCSYALCEIEAPECGDNTVDAGEECDDGNTANGDGCSSTCQLEGGANCGDTWVTGGEECDDGNTVNGDGCSSFCTEEPGWDCYHTDMWHTICTRCGDGVQNPEEECDDGNTNAWDDCSYPDCSLNPVCGNGVNEVGEQCDDGNTVSGDGCSSTCQIEAGGNCGDNIRDSPEEACDGSDLGGYVCADFGAYTGGPLSCHGPGAANECTFDFSGCINEPEARYYWTNMNGNEISEAQVGDTVRLVAEEVASGTFSIKEDDLVLDDDIRDVVGSGVGVDLVGVWTIGEDDLELASNNDGPLGEVGDYEFYFNLGGSMDSDILYVSPDEDDDPLVVFIEGVVCGSHFDEGSVSEITIVANDADDEIVGSVTIYGVTILFTNGGISFNQTFNSPGNVQILVEADTFAGDDRKRIISNVMVLDKASGSYVDGTYVAACIDKPADLSNIPGGLVEFDASSTRGVRVTGGAVDELIPGVDAFSWYWTFYPELIERNFVDSTESSAYIFEAVLPMAGTNTAELVVEVS